MTQQCLTTQNQQGEKVRTRKTKTHWADDVAVSGSSSLVTKEPGKSAVWADLLVKCREQERSCLLVSIRTTHAHRRTGHAPAGQTQTRPYVRFITYLLRCSSQVYIAAERQVRCFEQWYQKMQTTERLRRQRDDNFDEPVALISKDCYSVCWGKVTSMLYFGVRLKSGSTVFPFQKSDGTYTSKCRRLHLW